METIVALFFNFVVLNKRYKVFVAFLDFQYYVYYILIIKIKFS